MIALVLALALGAEAPKVHPFEVELVQAAKELNVPVPIIRFVETFEESPLAAAFVSPPLHGADGPWMVTGVLYHLDVVSKRRLRCWARHEMLHVWLKHRGGTRKERDRHHDYVRLFQEALWKEDASCLIE